MKNYRTFHYTLLLHIMLRKYYAINSALIHYPESMKLFTIIANYILNKFSNHHSESYRHTRNTRSIISILLKYVHCSLSIPLCVILIAQQHSRNVFVYQK